MEGIMNKLAQDSSNIELQDFMFKKAQHQSYTWISQIAKQQHCLATLNW